MAPKALATRAKVDRWEYMKQKLPHSKRNKMREHPGEWEKILANYIKDKG